MSEIGLKCSRCEHKSMFLRLREGYLECNVCGKKEVVDGDFGYRDFQTMVKLQEEGFYDR